MTREQAIRKREELAAKLSSPSGCPSRLAAPAHDSSLSTGCLKCARGEGHPLWVLTVGYPGGKTRQVSVRPEQVPLVRKAIEEYRDVKQALEAISELNQFLLRAGSRGSQRTGTPVVIAARCLQRKFLPMASSQRRWRISGNLGCGTPIKHWKMTPCFSSFRKSWPNAAGSEQGTRGRKATPAEVVLRMLLLKRCRRDWSYEVLSREVLPPIWSISEFTRVGGEKGSG